MEKYLQTSQPTAEHPPQSEVRRPHISSNRQVGVAESELPLEERLKLAEQHKLEGNQFLQSKEFAKAVESYSKAIAYNSESAVYYSNR